MTISAAEAWVVVRRNAELAACSQPNPISLRMAHGISALLITLAFFGGRLLNHGSAAFSPEFNHATMMVLRKWYRSDLV